MVKNSGVSLRAAVLADAENIVQLVRELSEYEKLLHEMVATPDLIKAHLFGAAPKAHALMIEVDGALAGFALYFYTFSTFQGLPGLYLEDLYVRPAFRSAGAGRAVLKYLARKAIEERCGRFEWSVLDWNEPAIKFYEKIGARAMDDWVMYRLDGEVLTKLAE